MEFEYKCASLRKNASNCMEKELDEYGKDAWELVSVTDNGDKFSIFFKRIKSNKLNE